MTPDPVPEPPRRRLAVVPEKGELHLPEAQRGFFVTLEGIDKSGKTTQVEFLRDALARRGLHVGYEGHPGETLREPGGTPLGEEVRELLLHRRHDVSGKAEALLYAAARAQLVADVVRPSLDAGWLVVLDRYIDSSLAYQGYGRELGFEPVLALNAVATGSPDEGPLWPDITLVLDLDPAVAASRQGGSPDRIEREGLELQRRVAAGYRELAARYSGRVHLLDGGREAATIAGEAERIVLSRLEERMTVGGA